MLLVSNINAFVKNDIFLCMVQEQRCITMGDSIRIALLETTATYEMFSIDFDKYSIKTIVTRSGSVVENWLSETKFIHRRRLHMFVVGLGVQWKPHPAGFLSPAATLQLCVGHRCLIFQIIHADYVPQSLANFLQEPNYNFVGVWNSSDASMLNSYGLHVDPIDLRYVAAEKHNSDCRYMSMARMANEILGMEGVEKPYWVGRSDWDAWSLSDEQIKYAALDACVSFELGKHLGVWEDNCEADDSYNCEDADYYDQ